jgi:hypothetical protein
MRTNVKFTYLMLFIAMLVTAMVYWPGLSGSFLFDDYPNILDNPGVQPRDASLASLVRAALSSPSSEFSRPLSSLSFAANYLTTGLNPYWMKLTNLVIHLLNGLLVFFLASALLESATDMTATSNGFSAVPEATSIHAHSGSIALLIAASWMLLPINLTAVLYIVQRMESLANLFVLIGLIGYVAARRRMLSNRDLSPATSGAPGWGDFWLCAASITLPTAFGLLAKETAVMLPFYALLIECFLYGFRVANLVYPKSADPISSKATRVFDRRLLALYFFVLAIPFIAGAVLLLPSLLQPDLWNTRNFTLSTRLLSEARIVIDYVFWTVLPTPHALSFYHDNFNVSSGVLAPWTTLASLLALAGLVVLTWWLSQRLPLTALGIAMFLGCQLLTGTILPLELIYEHRNYFASFGLLVAIVPILAAPRSAPFSLPRHMLLAGLMLCWTALTALTAYAWGNPLRLAQDLALRAPRSPRAQYELGRTYIVLSKYDPRSPFTRLAYAPLERSAALPDSSILPEQALIFMNAHMHLALKDAWWDSLMAKLIARKPGVQDESSLAALTQCAKDGGCNLPKQRMVDAYLAALSHPHPTARLMAMYGDYAWNVLGEHKLGERATSDAVKESPREPAYRVTLIHMLLVDGQMKAAKDAISQLQTLNIGGRLDAQMAELRALSGVR